MRCARGSASRCARATGRSRDREVASTGRAAYARSSCASQGGQCRRGGAHATTPIRRDLYQCGASSSRSMSKQRQEGARPARDGPRRCAVDRLESTRMRRASAGRCHGLYIARGGVFGRPHLHGVAPRHRLGEGSSASADNRQGRPLLEWHVTTSRRCASPAQRQHPVPPTRWRKS